jgi:endoglucanase Acf2
MIRFALFLLLLTFFHLDKTVAQQIFPGGGSGSYRLDYPGWNYAHHLYAPIGDNTTSHIHKGPNYTGPLQTHQWWSSALWEYGNIAVNDGAKTIIDHGHERHSLPMYPYPLFMQAEPQGYILRYGTADINGLPTEIEAHSAVIDIRVGLRHQSANSTQVDGYGDWHAVFLQNYGGGNTLRMTAAQGNPYAFFQRTGNITPVVYGLGKNILVKSTSGNSFIFSVAPEGRPVYFGAFFPTGTLLGNNAAPATPVSTVPTGIYGGGWDDMVVGMPAGQNYFSIALMPDVSQATLDLFESRAFNFVTNTTHSYTFSEAQSMLTTNFTTTTQNMYGGANTGTLQALLKHQYRYSPEATGSAQTGRTYLCPRGTMQLLATNTFTTEMRHHGILPALGWAHTYSPAQMRAYIDQYLPTIAIPQAPADGYNKDGLVDLANIAQIAGQIGHTAARDRCLDALQARLTNWFTSPTNEDWAIFVYNQNFNWLAHYPNGFTSSGHLIDMHFHMGYLIYGAAVLARYRPAWASQYGGMVETVIRQINDYRKDANTPGNIGWFPYLRHFDPYEGHSWADPSATNQESVSEALLFAQGTFLWGETTGHQALRDLGALLYITEAEAAKLYWFDIDEDINYNWGNGSYPQHHVSILRNRGASYSTFFTADERWRHSIVLLPQTAGSLWQVWDSSAAETIYSHLPPGGYPAWDDHGYHYNFVQAGFNPAAAVNAFQAYATAEGWINPTFPHVNGDIPMLYQWIHTIDSVGVYDPTVYADITGFGVFKKDSCKHYMIYMPPGKGPRQVSFSDNATFLVPDDTVVVYKSCNELLPVQWLHFEGKKTAPALVLLQWYTTDEGTYFVERSADGQTWQVIGEQTSPENKAAPWHYRMEDHDPLQGVNYYRVKKNDDGQFVYSKIIAVHTNHAGAGITAVFPNPSQDIFILTTSGPVEEYSFELYDLTGRKITAELIIQEQSGNQAVVTAGSWASGMYFLQAYHQPSQLKSIVKLIKE